MCDHALGELLRQRGRQRGGVQIVVRHNDTFEVRQAIKTTRRSLLLYQSFPGQDEVVRCMVVLQTMRTGIFESTIPGNTERSPEVQGPGGRPSRDAQPEYQGPTALILESINKVRKYELQRGKQPQGRSRVLPNLIFQSPWHAGEPQGHVPVHAIGEAQADHADVIPDGQDGCVQVCQAQRLDGRGVVNGKLELVRFEQLVHLLLRGDPPPSQFLVQPGVWLYDAVEIRHESVQHLHKHCQLCQPPAGIDGLRASVCSQHGHDGSVKEVSQGELNGQPALFRGLGQPPFVGRQPDGRPCGHHVHDHHYQSRHEGEPIQGH
mmetsp:Transcript_1095/g.7079  ORF Transcript_1095/g.7079 Transcript_1095/m.7079 type:complete len:320 (-) Transcript_1095:1453-2412(-)